MSTKRKRIISSALSLSLSLSVLGQMPLAIYAADSSGGGGAAAPVTPPKTPIYADQSYSFKERAADMIAKMSISQKASQMNSSISPSITLSDGKVIPTYGWWNEALHGVSRYQYNPNAGATTIYNATSYPIGFSMGSSWDPALMYEVATKIGDEARDTAPDSDRMLTFYSPTINLARDTRWGRTDETFSEDPLLTAEIASQFVNGLEGREMDGSLIDPNGYLKSVATIKHYTANNSEVNRLNGSSDMTDRELREYYTKPYRDIIEKTDVTSVMSSYNRINGVPSALSQYISETLLRQTFGFSGYITTDCDSLGVAVQSSRQAYVNPITNKTMTVQEAYAWGAMFGIDLVCNSGYSGPGGGATASYGGQLPGAAAAKVPTPEGVFTENAIDVDLLNLYTTRMKLGEFDDTVRNASGVVQESTNKVSWYDQAIARRTEYGNGSLWTYNNSNSNDGKNITEDRLETARKAAAQSIIMLRNNKIASNGNNPVLPIAVPATGNFKVVVYGPNANYNTGDNSFFLGGYSSNTGTSGINKMVNPYNGISAEIKKINPNAVIEWKKGFTNSGSAYANMTTLNTAEIDAASNYDLAIVCLGAEQATAAEDTDRGGNTNANNTLPGAQIALANAVAAKNPKMVTVIESTSPDDLTTLSADVPALLWSCYNGYVKGLGLSDVLLGKYNPSGRTSTLWFANSQFPSIRSYKVTPGADTYRTGNSTSDTTTQVVPGRTYMYYDGSNGAPLYSFGYGLSYSTFAYSDMTVSANTIDANGTIQVSCNVTNTSTKDGNEIVELYASQPDSTKTGNEKRPIKRLMGFKKVMVKAGQTVPVTLTVKIPDLRFYDEKAGKWVIDTGRYNLQFSKSSADSDIQLNKDIVVTGTLASKLSVVTAKPRQSTDAALDIPTRLFFEKGATVEPQITVAMSDDTLYGYIAKGKSKSMPAGMTVTYSSNRPGVVSVDASQNIKCVGPGVATVTANVSYQGVQEKTDFVVYVNPEITLSDLKVGGTTIKGFNPGVKNYGVAVPEAQTTAPTVSATASGTGSVTVQQASGIPGTAIITVTDSGFEGQYTVYFGRSPKSSEFKSAAALDSWWNIVRQDSGYSFDTANGVTISTARANTLNVVNNLVLQPATGDFAAQTHMTFSATPSANNQQGGLVLYKDDYNYVKLVYERSSGNTNRVAMYNVVNGSSTLVTGNTNSAAQTQMYLRLVRNGNDVSAQWSVDGNIWNTYSGTATVDFTSPQLGLIANNGNYAVGSIGVTYEYLRAGSAEDAKPFVDKIQQSGVDIPGFDPKITSYDVIVPKDALPDDYKYEAECSNKDWTWEYNPATTIPGVATIVVKSSIGSTTYSFKLNYKADSFNFVNTTTDSVLKFWKINSPDENNYGVIPGKGLRLATLQNDIYGAGANWKNLFSAPAGGDWDIVAKVYYPVAPKETYQQAMLLAYQDDNNYVKVDAERGGSGVVAQAGSEVNGTFVSAGSSSVLAPAADGSLTVYFRLTKTGTAYQGAYSRDGISYTNLGSPSNVSLNNIQVGLFATRNTSGAAIDAYTEYVQVLSGTENISISPDQMKLNAIDEVSKYVKSKLPVNISFDGGVATVQLFNDITPGYTISYDSNNPSVLSQTGLITQPAQSTSLTYTYTISDGATSATSTPITLGIPGSATTEQADLVITGVPGTINYGDITEFTLNTSGGTGLGAVTYAVASGDAVSVDQNTGLVTIKQPGTAVITVTKAGDATYFNKKKDVTIIVNPPVVKATSITIEPSVSNTVTEGNTLSTAILVGGQAKAGDVVVDGQFEWSVPNTVLTESGSYEVTFKPADSFKYLSSSIKVNVTVVPRQPDTVAAPSITTDPNLSTVSNDTIVTVSLATATQDAGIYYTIDGNEVTTSSILYINPFSISAPYTVGGTVTIKAIAAKDGIISAVSQQTITFEPAPEVPKFMLNITAATGGRIKVGTSDKYKQGDIVDIAALADANYIFSGWVSSAGGNFADSNSPTTTFTMPSNATTVSAIFTIVAPEPTFSLNITAGAGGKITVGTSGEYKAGDIISIAASADANYKFNGWTTSAGGSFADSSSLTTTFTMPGNATTITAVFTKVMPEPTFSLNITAGTGGKITVGTSGDYKAGNIISIAASADANYRFDGWTTSAGGSFADSNSPTTTFTMPGNATTITAAFSRRGGGGSGGGSSIVVPSLPPVPPVLPPTPSTPVTPAPTPVIISLTNGTVTKSGESLTLLVKPYVQNGRTMVGIRDIATVLEIDSKGITWNAKSKTILIKQADKEIKLVIGQSYAIVNGKKVIIDVAPQLKDGRAVLPLSHIAKILGNKIDFNSASKDATLTLK